MNGDTIFRASSTSDLPKLKNLYADAFPQEDLFPLVTELSTGDHPVHAFVAGRSGKIAGHVAFTLCKVSPGNATVALLAPLCTAPECQGQGLGSELVRTGFSHLQQAGIHHVFVLGDPEYYRRFGFQENRTIEPPFELPAEWKGAWQSVTLGDETVALSGKLVVPAPWNARELWAP